MAKIFYQLLANHFPRSHKLQKSFNPNTLKVSYSYMNIVFKIIKGHTTKVTSKPRGQKPKCNCRKKTVFPMDSNCQVNDIVNKCDLQRDNGRVTSITINYHLDTIGIPICNTFTFYDALEKRFKWNLKWSVLRCIPPVLKYLKQSPLVFIWKTRNSYISNSEETLER